jgi:thiol-disulfide isomerase/thioredoxin
MRKKLFLLQAVFCIFFFNTIQAQLQNFTFTIKVDSLKNGVSYPMNVHLINNTNSDTLIYSDTLTPEKNYAIIKGFVKEEYYIYFQIKRAGMFDCSIGPNDSAFLRVTAMKFGEDYDIFGSIRPVVMANYLYKQFIPQSAKLNAQQKLIDSLTINGNDKNKLQTAKRVYDSLYTSYYRYNIQFADTSASAVAVSYSLYKYIEDDSKYDIYPSIEKALNKFGNIVTINALLKDYNSRLHTETKHLVGDKLDYLKLFRQSSQADYKKVLNKNKLVLIDFWASWCIPCREEFPYLNEAYKQFKNKGFDIVSISLDKNKEAWMKASKTINNSWKNNYWDNKGWESESVKLLKIKSIPRNYLIDNKGKIYAKDIRGVEILDILRKLL